MPGDRSQTIEKRQVASSGAVPGRKEVRGNEPLGRVDQHDRDPGAQAHDPVRVGSPQIAATMLAQIDAVQLPYDVARRNRAHEVGRQSEQEDRHQASLRPGP